MNIPVALTVGSQTFSVALSNNDQLETTLRELFILAKGAIYFDQDHRK